MVGCWDRGWGWRGLRLVWGRVCGVVCVCVCVCLSVYAGVVVVVVRVSPSLAG